MKNFLRIKGDLNSSVIESYFSELEKSSTSINLVIPSNLKFNFLGNKIALTQFINTWVRYSKKGRLFIYDSEENIEKQLHDLAIDSIHSLTAIIMSEEKGIYGYTSKKNLTEKIIPFCDNELLRLLKPINSIEKHSNEYYQIHIDHKGKKFWFTDDLYQWDIHSAKYKAKPKLTFTSFANNIVNSCTPKSFFKINNGYVKIEIEKIANILSPLIYELFDNTINWASNINDIGNTTPNCRSIYFRFMNNEYSQIEKSIVGLKPIEEYLKNNPNIIHQTEENKQYGFFLELSILDSGIGLATQFDKTIGNRNFKAHKFIEEEYETIRTCFEKHKTSIIGYPSQTRGMGLFNVLSTLGNIAFLKLRTGHLFLYRDFTKTPFLKETPDTTLFDINDDNCFVGDAKKNIRRHSWAEGTLFTILLPLRLI